MKQLMRGLQRRIRSEGAWSTLCDAATRSWRRAFRHRQLIYEMSATVASDLEAPKSLGGMERYVEAAALPQTLRADFSEQHGPHFVAYVESNLRSGALLYVLREDGHIASFLWAKPGDRVLEWYVSVGAQDVILYGWWTDPAMRGRGLIRQLIAAATRDALPQAKRFLADVRVWNAPSIRAMERVGFRRIAEAKPR